MHESGAKDLLKKYHDNEHLVNALIEAKDNLSGCVCMQIYKKAEAIKTYFKNIYIYNMM